jgi:hypothetical protein
MRASDGDRQATIERLRAALDEGRLKMDEYLDRMGMATEAVTYGDLAPLVADLPAASAVVRPAAAQAAEAAAPAPAPAVVQRGVVASLPLPLRILWTIWLTAVTVNVVVWVLASGTVGHLLYPWPLWVAGPAGAALFGVSAGITRMRRGHQRP